METLPPYKSLEKISLPRSSVPNICTLLGLVLMFSKSVVLGSNVANIGANIAIITKTIIIKLPTTASLFFINFFINICLDVYVFFITCFLFIFIFPPHTEF